MRRESKVLRERQRQIRMHYVQAAAHTAPRISPAARQITGGADRPAPEALLLARLMERRRCR